MTNTEFGPPAALELIKTGELYGRQALEILQGQYLFHGTDNPHIQEFECRQATHDGHPDGPPSVVATTKPDQAIFRSMIRGGSAWVGDGQTTYFLVLRSVLEAIPQHAEGYVYAFAQTHSSFSRFRGEMRSFKPVVPDIMIKVHKSDLPPVIVFDSLEQLKHYQQQLRLQHQAST